MALSALRVAQVGSGTPHLLDKHAQCYARVDDLLSQGNYDIVVLDQSERDENQSLTRLRSDPRYSYVLIYSVRVATSLFRALGDGQLPSTEDQLLLEFRTWNDRYQVVKDALTTASLEYLVLAWLWTGPERKLRSCPAPSTPALYNYPVLELFAHKGADNDFFWTLQFMVQQGLIEPDLLEDRIRRCSNCGSGHLNYVDICPECNSLNIQRRPSLHCFVCGHIGAQESFLKDGGMFCPNCMSRLRHIGSDYDRPIENYSCSDCDAFFVDALVQARCMDCRSPHDPDRLKVQQIYTYKLADAGRLRCRYGPKDSLDLDAHFDFNGLVNMDVFAYVLDWLLDIEHRYKKSTFSLLGLRFVNLRETLQQMGERQGYALLDAMAARLIEIIRETDRCARPTDDILWVLLPETGRDGAERVLERLGSLTELFSQAGVHIEFRTVSFSAPHDVVGEERAALLLGRLSGQLMH